MVVRMVLQNAQVSQRALIQWEYRTVIRIIDYNSGEKSTITSLLINGRGCFFIII